jgi:hypothetical protein
VCFDSYNDKRTGFEFDLTAGGSEIDLILGNGENEWDTTWDAVWSQGRTDDSQAWDGTFQANWNALWRAEPDNVFLIKLSYWFSP